MKIEASDCKFLNYHYNNKEKINEFNNNKNVNKNKYEKNKLKNLFSPFSEIEKEYFINFLDNIIKENNKTTLDYKNLDKSSKSELEKKRNKILTIIIKYFENNFDNFNDQYIFKMIDIIDKYIYFNFDLINSNDEKIMIIIHATFRLLSKFDNIIYNFNNDEIKNIEFDILHKLNYNLNFISSLEVMNCFWNIINNKKKNKTYYMALLLLIVSLYSIELLQYDKISLVISALFYAGEITGNQINKNNIYLLFQYNENRINIIEKKIEEMLNFVVKNQTFDYLFKKFEDKKYLEVGKIYFE